jgi:hypothetical protein
VNPQGGVVLAGEVRVELKQDTILPVLNPL